MHTNRFGGVLNVIRWKIYASDLRLSSQVTNIHAHNRMQTLANTYQCAKSDMKGPNGVNEICRNISILCSCRHEFYIFAVQFGAVVASAFEIAVRVCVTVSLSLCVSIAEWKR